MDFIDSKRVSGLFFLILFSGYGYFAQDIHLDFWSEEEAFNARTLPYVVAGLGAAVSLLLLISPGRIAPLPRLGGLAFRPMIVLIGAMALFTTGFEWLGFLPATIVFLAAAMLVLGERRPPVLIAGALPVPLAFWGLMFLLEIQLPAGDLWYTLGLLS